MTHLVLANCLVLWSGDREGGQGLDFLLQAGTQLASLCDQFIELCGALGACCLVGSVESARMEVLNAGDVAAELGDAVLHGGNLIAGILSLARPASEGSTQRVWVRDWRKRKKCVLDCRNLPSHLDSHCRPQEIEGPRSHSRLQGSSIHGQAVGPGAVAGSHELPRGVVVSRGRVWARGG